MSSSDLLADSALAQAERIRRGEVSSPELTRAYLERIARLNPALNAFVRVHHRGTIAKRILDAMGDADLWLTPANSQACRPRRRSRARHCSVSTPRPQISGAPAASIPMGKMAGRWPMGAQPIGRIGQDAVVVAVSRQLEEALPWSVAPVS